MTNKEKAIKEQIKMIKQKIKEQQSNGSKKNK